MPLRLPGDYSRFHRRYRRLGLFVGELTHHLRLGYHHAIHLRLPVHLRHRSLPAGDLHFHYQLIAWNHRTPELRLLDRSKQNKLIVPVRNSGENQYAGNLRHRLHNQHPGHNREIGEVAGEERLIGGYILDPDDTILFQFDNRINQKHGIAVRKNVADGLDVKNGHKHGKRRLVEKTKPATKPLLYQAMPSVLDFVKREQPAIIAMIREFVGCESPSDDAAAVNRFVDLAASKVAGAAKVKTLPGGRFGKHLRCEFTLPGRKKEGQILVLAHSDTVWPMGTLSTMPFRQDKGRLWGPGVLDMKSGIVFFLFAMRALRELDMPVQRKVLLQINSDEEVGSESSRPLTEEAARKSNAVLVLEPGTGLEGKLKTARKGVGDYSVQVHGKASHAGVDFQNGASAVVELARQIEKIAGFTQLERGITVNPGVVAGGTRTNVVAAEARVEVDIRVARLKDAPALDRKFHALKAVDKRCRVEVTGGLNRPPMERTAAVVRLFQQAKELAASLGVEIEESATGGGSDGNFTAALGIPTLDGLGGVGEGAHASNESILVNRIADRTALLALLAAGRLA